MTEQSIIEAAAQSGLDLNDPAIAAAIEATRRVGIRLERERVVVHLEAGEKVGDLKMAITAILNGEDLTPTHMGHYLQAARRGAELAARLADDVAVLDATARVKRPPSTHTDPQAVAVFEELRRLVGGGDGDVAIEDLEAGE